MSCIISLSSSLATASLTVSQSTPCQAHVCHCVTLLCLQFSFTMYKHCSPFNIINHTVHLISLSNITSTVRTQNDTSNFCIASFTSLHLYCSLFLHSTHEISLTSSFLSHAAVTHSANYLHTTGRYLSLTLVHFQFFFSIDFSHSFHCSLFSC